MTEIGRRTVLKRGVVLAAALTTAAAPTARAARLADFLDREEDGIKVVIGEVECGYRGQSANVSPSQKAKFILEAGDGSLLVHLAQDVEFRIERQGWVDSLLVRIDGLPEVNITSPLSRFGIQPGVDNRITWYSTAGEAT